MAQINWIGGSGSWGQASNWGGTLPGITDNVTIEVPGISVSIGTGIEAQAQSLTVIGSTLDITGGSLFTAQNAVFDGGYVQVGGTYTMSGQGATFDTGINFAGGTIDDLSGAVSLLSGGLLSGTLAGGGALDIVGGSAYVDAGFSASIASIVVGAQGGKLGFNINFTYKNNFTLLQNGVLDLFGHTLKLTGPSLIEGVVSNGKLMVSTTSTLGGPLNTTVLDNGLVISVLGTMVQDGNVAMGANDSGAKIIVAKNSQYQINGNWFLSNPASVATITNAGTFAKTFGAKTSLVNASFSSTGTVAVNVGTLLLNGLVNSLAGTISGGGTLGLAGGQTTLANKVALNVASLDQQGGVLVLNHALGYAGAWDMTGGVLDFNASAAKLTLTAASNFDGGTITGFGGGITIKDTAQFGSVTIGGPITLDVVGTVDQSATITFGASSNPITQIEAGANWIIEGDSAILGFFGLFENAGSFIDPNGSGNAVVQAEFINTGTVKVNNSTLTLAGANALGGTLAGTGLLDLQGATGIDAGVVITVAQLAVDNASVYLGANVAYANTFIEDGNNGTLYLQGSTLTLSGAASLDGGLLTDGGVMSTTGAVVVGGYSIGGGATLSIGGSGEQDGFVNLVGGNLDVTAHGTYALDDDYNIGGVGNLINAGLFTSSTSGTNQVAAFLTNTGTLVANNQLLQFGGGGLIGGTLAGSGTLQLSSFAGISQYTFNSGLTITAGNFWLGSNTQVNLAGNVSYGGQFAWNGGGINLEGNSFSLTGTSSLAADTLSGPGTVSLGGVGTISGLAVVSGALLSIGGNVEQSGSLYVGDQPSLTQPPSTAELLVTAAGTLTLDANCSIINNGTLAVAGHLIASGDGTSTIGASIVDSGVISANLGLLDVLGAVGGSGTFSIGSTGLLEFDTKSTVSATDFVSFSAGGGALVLGETANFAATLENFAKGDEIALAGFQLGTLTAAFANNAQTAVTFADGNGASVTLTFSTAQTLSAFTYQTGPFGFETIGHN